MSGMIRVNGRNEPLAALTVTELLQRLGVDPQARGAAVAINGAVVPRRDWPRQRLEAGDDVEVVRPFAGG